MQINIHVQNSSKFIKYKYQTGRKKKILSLFTGEIQLSAGEAPGRSLTCHTGAAKTEKLSFHLLEEGSDKKLLKFQVYKLL